MHASLHAWTLVPLLALSITGCGPKASGDEGRDTGHFNIRDKTYTLNAPGVPPARLGPDGELVIGGQAVELTAAQRELARRYHAEVGNIAHDGIELGKQGAALAGQALAGTLQGLLKGDTEGVGARIQAQGEQIKSEALKICDRLQQLRTAQDDLVAALPAFAPYAELDAKDITQCRDGTLDALKTPRTPADDVPPPPDLQDDSTRA